MNLTEQHRWANAHTLAALGHLTALWLEGHIASQPGSPASCGPGPETLELIPILAALNRAGFLTVVSQPGQGPARGRNGEPRYQRAGVSGYTNPALANFLTALAAGEGLLVLRHEGVGYPRPGEGVQVTRYGPRPVTVFGRRRSRFNVYDQYQECSKSARKEIRKAVQLTIVDSRWGRNDLLWAVLKDALWMP